LELKVQQLLLRGLRILLELREPFAKEWKKILSASKTRNISLAEEFDTMILFAFQEYSNQENVHVDTFILTLLTEWQKRFSMQRDEEESIFLVTTIENTFHRLLSENSASTFLDHQAIQTFFSRILDHSFLTQNLEKRTEKWLKMILSTNVVPIKWLAVVKRDSEDFTIEKVVCSDNGMNDNHLIEMCTGLKANQIDHLTMAISRLLGSLGSTPIVQIPCLNDTLVVCPDEHTNSVSPQQIEIIRTMYLRQLKLHQLESNMEWKDASLLFLQRLLRSRNADEAVQTISKGLVDYMPFQRCALFLYNQYEDKGIGVSGYNVNSPSVQQIKEEIFKLPLIKKFLYSLTHSQPLFFSNAAEVLPEKYVREYKLKSIVVLPLFVPSESKLLGIALLDRGEDSEFAVSTQTLTTLIKFGHYAGELINSFWEEAIQQFGNPNCVLTAREKDVLKLIADGFSINEAAQKLHLSSYTVRDYVSVIIQKLSAKNRTDAAVKAIRMNLIS
jgi:DNA-binding CsgD family transcriptional regulator